MLFYYDETNNVRKLSIRDGSFNVQNEYFFVLGGIAFKNKIDSERIESLFLSLNLPKNVSEIKLKTITKGKNFFDIIRSEGLYKILSWIYKNAYIHYTSLDFFYWTIVDIIDSIDYNFNFIERRIMKNILYEELNHDKNKSISLFYKYNYPNISNDEKESFLDELNSMVSDITIKKYLKKMMTQDELIFIQNEKSRTSIDTFSTFYGTRIKKYINSKHIFDNEFEVEEKLLQFKSNLTKFENLTCDFEFIDSKCSKEIQLSDVFVGLISSFIDYIVKNDKDIIYKDITLAQGVQKEILILIYKIFVKNDNFDKYLIDNIQPDTFLNKRDFMLNVIFCNFNNEFYNIPNIERVLRG